MENNERDSNYTDRGEYNQRLGRELYSKDRERNPTRSDYRRPDQEWGEGTYFHTGPSRRGAQDRDKNEHSRPYNRGGASHSSYEQGQHAHLSDHYGSRRNSAYRNERSYLNHGDNAGDSQNRYGNISSLPGNYSDQHSRNTNAYNEGPGSRSRYKEDDYRYGSGSHNWYREERYTPDEDRSRRQDDRGFFQRMGEGIRDTWNDIMHADDPDYQDRHPRQHIPEKGSDRVRMGSEPYRDMRYNRGYEGGPRWADETDSGRNDYYDDIDRDQRYRR